MSLVCASFVLLCYLVKNPIAAQGRHAMHPAQLRWRQGRQTMAPNAQRTRVIGVDIPGVDLVNKACCRGLFSRCSVCFGDDAWCIARQRAGGAGQARVGRADYVGGNLRQVVAKAPFLFEARPEW